MWKRLLTGNVTRDVVSISVWKCSDMPIQYQVLFKNSDYLKIKLSFIQNDSFWNFFGGGDSPNSDIFRSN